MIRRRIARRRKVVRRRRVAKRIGGTGSKLIEKKYSYVMTPNPAYLSSDITPGNMVVSPASAPLIGTNISAATASKTSFAGYYDFGVSIPFKLSDLANYTAFTGIYDNYKINSIILDLEYMSTNASVSSAAVMPTVTAVVDHDDVVVPTLISQVSGRQGHKVFKFGNKMKSSYRIKIVPRVAMNVYNPLNATSIGYAQGQGWQDSVYPANEYYGLKLWFTDVLLPGSATGVNTAFRWKFTYNVSFKGAINEF